MFAAVAQLLKGTVSSTRSNPQLNNTSTNDTWNSRAQPLPLSGVALTSSKSSQENSFQNSSSYNLPTHSGPPATPSWRGGIQNSDPTPSNVPHTPGSTIKAGGDPAVSAGKRKLTDMCDDQREQSDRERISSRPRFATSSPESGGLWQAWDSAGREGAPRLAHGLESPRVGAKRKSNALVRILVELPEQHERARKRQFGAPLSVDARAAPVTSPLAAAARVFTPTLPPVLRSDLPAARATRRRVLLRSATLNRHRRHQSYQRRPGTHAAPREAPGDEACAAEFEEVEERFVAAALRVAPEPAPVAPLLPPPAALATATSIPGMASLVGSDASKTAFGASETKAPSLLQAALGDLSQEKSKRRTKASAAPATNAAAPAFLFGATAASSSAAASTPGIGAALAASPASTPAGFAFGSAGASSQSTTSSLLGTTAAAAASSGAASFVFGAASQPATPALAFGGAPSTLQAPVAGFTFGAAQAAPAASSTGGLFGGGVSAPAPAGGFSMGAPPNPQGNAGGRARRVVRRGKK